MSLDVHRYGTYIPRDETLNFVTEDCDSCCRHFLFLETGSDNSSRVMLFTEALNKKPNPMDSQKGKQVPPTHEQSPHTHPQPLKEKITKYLDRYAP